MLVDGVIAHLREGKGGAEPEYMITAKTLKRCRPRENLTSDMLQYTCGSTRVLVLLPGSSHLPIQDSVGGSGGVGGLFRHHDLQSNANTL